jgi:hypothetical protein
VLVAAAVWWLLQISAFPVTAPQHPIFDGKSATSPTLILWPSTSSSMVPIELVSSCGRALALQPASSTFFFLFSESQCLCACVADFICNKWRCMHAHQCFLFFLFNTSPIVLWNKRVVIHRVLFCAERAISCLYSLSPDCFRILKNALLLWTMLSDMCVVDHCAVTACWVCLLCVVDVLGVYVLFLMVLWFLLPDTHHLP